jgi:hypothetical protein
MLHFEHSFVWCWNWDGLGSRKETAGKVLKCGAGRRMEKIRWTDYVRGKEVFFLKLGSGS